MFTEARKIPEFSDEFMTTHSSLPEFASGHFWRSQYLDYVIAYFLSDRRYIPIGRDLRSAGVQFAIKSDSDEYISALAFPMERFRRALASPSIFRLTKTLDQKSLGGFLGKKIIQLCTLADALIIESPDAVKLLKRLLTINRQSELLNKIHLIAKPATAYSADIIKQEKSLPLVGRGEEVAQRTPIEQSP